MGIATVLREGAHGEITHVYFCTIEGERIYLTKLDNDKMLEFSKEQIDEYYSGEAEDEVDSLKEDVLDILSGERSPEVIKYRIAVSTKLIDKRDVIKMH